MSRGTVRKYVYAAEARGYHQDGPPPPKDTSIIGLAYNFGPDRATFDPPITLTRSYDPNDIPEGVAEEDLGLAWYDEAGDKWVELDCVVDTRNDTITASIAHFTTFAIIGIVRGILVWLKG